MKGNRFKQDNRGASLLAVLVLMVVVSLIAVVITKITIVNIEMKEVERGTKKNFYSADELMDNLRKIFLTYSTFTCYQHRKIGRSYLNSNIDCPIQQFGCSNYTESLLY